MRAAGFRQEEVWKCWEWAEVAARISVERLTATAQANVLVTGGRTGVRTGMLQGHQCSLCADGLHLSLAKADGSPWVGGAASCSTSPQPMVVKHLKSCTGAPSPTWDLPSTPELREQALGLS